MSNKMAHVIYSVDAVTKKKDFPCDNVKLNGPFFEFFNDGKLVKVIPVNSIKDIDFSEDAKVNSFTSLVLPVMECMRKNHSENCKLIVTGHGAEVVTEESIIFLGVDLAENEDINFDVTDTFMVIESQDDANEYRKAACANNFGDHCHRRPIPGDVVWCNKMALMFADNKNVSHMMDAGYKQVILVDGKLVYKLEQ